MIGNLTVVYFEEGLLRQATYQDLDTNSAALVMAETIKTYPNAQFTWNAQRLSS